MAPTRRPNKPTVSPGQKPKHTRAATDPLVNPGNPPHRHQTCAKADSTGAYHRMVILAQSPPGCRSARSLQKKATVVLGHGHHDGIRRGRQELWMRVRVV